MRIVFGHNHFLTRRFTPSELGITDGDNSGIYFEVRQRYAHLFWIPFFGIGKYYLMRKSGDPNQYVMPDSIKALVDAKYPPKTPWYTFAGFWAILAGFCIYGLNNVASAQRWESNFHNTAYERKGYIQYPTTGDYYALTLTDKDNNYQSRKDLFLKVRKYTDDNIEFISLYPSLDQQSGYSSFYLRDAIEAFDTAARFAYNPLTIPKAVLIRTVDTVYNHTTAPVYIEALKSYCVLSEMERRKLN